MSNAQVDAIESDEYFQKRSLKGSAVGWVLLVSLGVAYTVSGDFSGWNYGMEHGGWLGLAIAWLIMGIMYLCTVFGLAELSSAIPTAGAGYGFARSAMGRTAGFATGLALVIEYVCAPAAISTFIANYILALGLLPEGTPPFAIVVAVYALFTAIHAIGVGEALKFMFVVSAIAVVALAAFVAGIVPHFDMANLFNMPADGIVRLERSVAYGYCRRHRFAAVRHLVFLRRRRRAAGGGGIGESEARYAARLDRSAVHLGCHGLLQPAVCRRRRRRLDGGIFDAPLVDALNAVGQSGAGRRL